MKKYRSSIILWLVFEAIAIWLWQATGNLFFLLNFSYIGFCIGFGGILFAAGWKYAREFTQFGVGTYMLVFLGLICRENMQIEGLWYYLLCGVWGAGTLHYAIAKIFGPLLFGRGWCGYACWTAMILDLLPYKQPKESKLWEMPEGLSNGGRGEQERSHSQECYRVHPLSEVYEGLSDKGFVCLNCKAGPVTIRNGSRITNMCYSISLLYRRRHIVKLS